MKAKCPLCGKEHDSEAHDEGWYFACCAWVRLAWARDANGALCLKVHPDDEDELSGG